MTDPYCNRCGTPHHAGGCGRDNAIRTPTDDDLRTDGLRDRIFKAIHDNCNLPEQRCRDIAGAVHEALNMTAEHDYGTTYPKTPVTDVRYTRYVTEWMPDA